MTDLGKLTAGDGPLVSLPVVGPAEQHVLPERTGEYPGLLAGVGHATTESGRAGRDL